MSKATGFLKPSLDDDFAGSTWKEDKPDLVRPVWENQRSGFGHKKLDCLKFTKNIFAFCKRSILGVDKKGG